MKLNLCQNCGNRSFVGFMFNLSSLNTDLTLLLNEYIVDLYNPYVFDVHDRIVYIELYRSGCDEI